MTTFDTEDLQTELNTIHNKLDKSMETTNEVKETIIKSEHESHTHIPKSGLIPRPRTVCFKLTNTIFLLHSICLFELIMQNFLLS